jgi:cytochrome c biogenesis protein CcdA
LTSISTSAIISKISLRRYCMSNAVLIGIIAIIAGIVVLAWDDAIRVTVGVFLILWGIISFLRKE